MDVGRWYRDNSGQEYRYIGTPDYEESIGLFSDGEKTFKKSLSDFEDMPKERKLFKFFGKGGITANDLLEARSFFGEAEWKKLKRQDKINSARYLKRTGKIGYKKGGKLPEPEESQEFYAAMQYDDGGMTISDWLAKKMSEVTHYDIVVVAKSKPSGREGWLSSVTYETKVEAGSINEAEEKAEREFKKLYPNESIAYINAFADTSAFIPSMSSYAKGGEISWDEYIKPMIKNLNKLLNSGKIKIEDYTRAVFNLKNPKYAEGGELKEDFLEDMQELHNDIKEITLRDGSKISHEELMEAHLMAEDDDDDDDDEKMTDNEGNLIHLKVGDFVVEYKKPNANQPKREMGGQGKIILIIDAMAKVEYENNYEEWIPLNDLKKVDSNMADGGEVTFGKSREDKFYNVKESIENGKVVFRGKMAEGGEIVTDRAEVQKIKNSIQEGELILRAGKSYGRKLSADELESIRESVNRSRKRIGLDETIYAKGGKTPKFKIGDKVKIDYISDYDEHNGKVGKITDLREANYYPNGDESVIEKITYAEITYDDGSTEDNVNLYREGSGLVSPVKKVKEDGGMMAKGGKTPVVVRTQFEEEEFEYEDGGILAEMSNRDKAKVFSFLDEYTKSNEVSTWWDYFGYTKEQADDIEKGWARSRGYMGKGGKISKYDDGAFAGYKMNRGGKDWFIIRHKSYDTGKIMWNVYANTVDGENFVDGFNNKYSAIYYIKNIYTNPDWQ
jgi:hypothetical protein